MRYFLKIIFIITLLELFIGGGGRVFEIFGSTLRILLFFMNILITGLLYINRAKIPNHVVLISIITLVSLLFYSVLGLINGAPFALIAEDVKPLSYVFSILFFSYYIDSEQRARLVVALLKKTSLWMGLLYLFIQVLFYFNKIQFHPFWRFVNHEISDSDFFFRGTSGLFFYKGFMYMIIGLIFWIHSPRSTKKTFPILVISTAMLLSGTRGFVVMFGLLYALFYGLPYLLKLNLKMLLLGVIGLLCSLYFFRNINLGNKNLSDSTRILQLQQVLERVNPMTFLIGHGFGNGVPIRKVHFEIGYLEVFHKQGILGLALWAILIIFIYNQYAKYTSFMEIRKAFYLSILFVLLLSLTNPFFNNPIGLSLLMISLSALMVLNKSSKEEVGTLV